jgi:hypothetical protein
MFRHAGSGGATNALTVTIPTITKSNPIARQTTPTLRLARSPCAIPHLAQKSQIP